MSTNTGDIDRIQNALTIYQPPLVQRSKARTGERGLGTVVALVEVHAAIATCVEIPPHLVNHVRWERRRQLLGEGGSVQV